MSQAGCDKESDLQTTTMYRILSHEEKRRLEAPLILGTAYNINHSETKKINIGLQPRIDGSIQPVVKLQNNNTAGGIVFDSATWTALQIRLPQISKYFKGTQKRVWGTAWRTPAPLIVGDCEIQFTTSFGSKSIVFDRRCSEDKENEDENEKETPAMDDGTLDAEPSSKKKRPNYSPAVVMQKPTFEGLLNIIVCIDERFRRLQRNVSHVEKCVEVLCAELMLHIPATESSENIDENRVKELIKNNFVSLKNAVQLRMDPTFVEHTFDIVFVELSVLCANFIANELIKALGEKKTDE